MKARHRTMIECGNCGSYFPKDFIVDDDEMGDTIYPVCEAKNQLESKEVVVVESN